MGAIVDLRYAGTAAAGATSGMRIVLAAFAAIAFGAAAARAELTAPPAWFLEEIKALTADGGRWITDNSAYRSEQEHFDQYGIEWRRSFDGASMTGRLFGLNDGKEAGDFWEFRQYWHPGQNEAVLEQFGWGGALGVGRLWREGEKTKADQTFYSPDGTPSRIGHVAWFPDPDTHDSESFVIEDGKWTRDRRYIWKRARSTTSN